MVGRVRAGHARGCPKGGVGAGARASRPGRAGAVQHRRWAAETTHTVAASPCPLGRQHTLRLPPARTARSVLRSVPGRAYVGRSGRTREFGASQTSQENVLYPSLPSTSTESHKGFSPFSPHSTLHIECSLPFSTHPTTSVLPLVTPLCLCLGTFSTLLYPSHYINSATLPPQSAHQRDKRMFSTLLCPVSKHRSATVHPFLPKIWRETT